LLLKYDLINQRNFLPEGGNVDAGVACGNAAETSSGGEKKYEGIAFFTDPSAQTKAFIKNAQHNILIKLLNLAINARKIQNINWGLEDRNKQITGANDN